QELQNQIISSPNPTCTLLNTIYINIKDEKNKATQSLEMLNNMELNIEMMKEEISKMQKIAISQANQTQTEIFDIQNNRDKLTNELFQMSNATNQSATSIQEMTTQLDIMISQFKEIASTDANTVIKPIKTSIKSLTAKKINTLEMLFPAIIIMVILFEGILLGNSLIMREKKSRAFFRNQILPISDFMFSIGTYITTIILTLIQVTIVIIIGLLIFKVNIIFQFFPLLTLIILSILIFSSIGMLIGYLTNSDETAILIAVILAIILMIFSNLVIPLETMQQTIGTIAQFTPFNISEQILRRSMIFGASLISSPIHTIAFVVELALLIIGVMFAHKKAFSQKN
ncbi:ABC transporter permease, partial [Candidatus Woesearchaeota archaeon]|nr:ABC transporter permease [Candidatus Woesearchaeota archaeon]